MKIILLIVGVSVVIISTIFFLRNKPEIPTSTPNKDNHAAPTQVSLEAKFAIFTNGTYRIFTDSKYHNLSKDVFIEPASPSNVIVKKSGIVWSDFFSTLPMSLKKDCLITGTGQSFCTNEEFKLRFFINGKEAPNALDKQIKNGDRLLVTYGDESDSQINNQQQQLE